MLVVETIARIRRDHLVRGVPIKKIARDLRVSKNTVRKVVRGDETSYGYERKIQPMPKLGPWVDELERQLEANEKKARRDRLSLLRIHEDLASLGYEGGSRGLRGQAATEPAVHFYAAAPVHFYTAVDSLPCLDVHFMFGQPRRRGILPDGLP